MPNWFSLWNMHGMEYLSGFFPATQENLQRWGCIVEKDLMEVDLLFTWQENEKILTCTVLLIHGIIRHLNRPNRVLSDAAVQQS